MTVIIAVLAYLLVGCYLAARAQPDLFTYRPGPTLSESVLIVVFWPICLLIAILTRQ